MVGGVSRILLYIGIIILPMVIVTIAGGVTQGIVYELGRNTALAAFMLIFGQVLLAARIKWIERPFGLDILLRFHKYMGMTAVAFLVLHPLLLAAGSGRVDLLISLDQPWFIWLGKIGLLLLLANIAISLYSYRLKLQFEAWRLIHDILAPVLIVMAFTHSLVAGDDLQHPLMRGLWIALLIIALGLYVWHRFIRPISLKKRPWQVVDVTSEAPNVWTVKLSPPEGGRVYDYLPGQFQFITFYRGRGLPVEEHHWTISSSPMEKNFVSSTIKALGDFTATIKDTRPGDKAAVQGPFGRFSHVLHPGETDLVFVAGGIGITPLMSMLRYMRDKKENRSVLLLYGNPNTEQIAFRREIEEIEAGGTPRLKVVHVLSTPEEDWSGERGHIDAEKITRYCGPDLSGKTFYVCGPPPLVTGVVNALLNMGVAHRQIRIEIFSFLD
ncbi:MAG: ferric reductase-like transmembrane domain-containing protein [Desulfobacterales bacterium]|nr:ferric reductase-like transmembrane domain-containing protein [Desulfobacterales bacterium]